MRITDDQLIDILERDGPVTMAYVASLFNVTKKDDKKRISHKLAMLTKYRILKRTSIGGEYIYYIPGDRRAPNHRPEARRAFNEVSN